MKRFLAITLVMILTATGCAPSFDKSEVVEDDTDTENTEKESIIPEYQISDQYYQTLLPYETSDTRGLVTSNINTRLDLEEFETGLMRLSQDPFPTDEYVFREGQVISKETVTSWLQRKYTSAQLKEKKMTADENMGLNPVDDGKGDIEERYEKNPEYLAHILEHNYLVKSDNNKVTLGGISIGLALNSVFYYQKEKYGETYEIKIDAKTLQEKGEEIAAEVVKRVRGLEGAKDVPILIALFEQERTPLYQETSFLIQLSMQTAAKSPSGRMLMRIISSSHLQALKRSIEMTPAHSQISRMMWKNTSRITMALSAKPSM